MSQKFKRFELATSAATLALVVGCGAAFAQQQNDAPVAGDKFMAVVESMQSVSAESTATPVDADSPNGEFRKLTVPTKGVYRFEAPANSGIKLYIDEELAIDTTGTGTGEGTVKAIQALSAGEHSIRLETRDGSSADLAAINFGAIGSDPRSLAEATVSIAPSEALELATKNTARMPSAERARTAQTEAGGAKRPFGLAGNGDKAGFKLGGSSSKAAKRGPRPAAANAAADASGGAAAVPTRFASLAGAPRAAAPAAAPAASGGGVSAVPSVNNSTSGNRTPNSSGTPTAPGRTPVTPVVAPAPAPTPTPVDPGTTPTAETVQASPLSPPTNVEITQAVQLTSAGNANAQVPNSGSTLFGAVMNNSMFDIVNVSVSGSNRTTTVDVGPMTGQFAVRLFPDDFASGNTVQVTLTGASSASDEVEATPVTYTVTGMPAQDGVSQALSRLTFGATPELYARIRAIGFQNYVEEQLNPAAINDAAFNAMNPNAILTPNEPNGNTLLRKLVHHELAHAAFSEKQLQVVMGQFWANHFHAVTKDTNMYSQNIDDRRFFRENAFTTFR